jgi:hypothetical protein
VPANEKFVEIEFPLGGLNLENEVQEQAPQTTISAENVRSLNIDTLRVRGGSRGGLDRFCQDPVPADTTQTMLIQHLNVIVDPQAPAFRSEFLIPDETWVEDPLNPGLYVPPGGSGNPPSPQESEEAAFVQQANKGHALEAGVTSSLRTVAFSSNVTDDNLILVAVSVSALNSPSVAVSDTQGNTYTLIEQITGSGNLPDTSVWRTFANGNGPLTVTATITTGVAGIGSSIISILEYTGISGVTPVLHSDQQDGAFSASSGQLSTGTIPCDSNANIVVAFFQAAIGTSNVSETHYPTVYAPTGMIERLSAPDTGSIGAAARFFVVDSLVIGTLTLVGGGVEMTLDWSTGGAVINFNWGAIGVCLKRA